MLAFRLINTHIEPETDPWCSNEAMGLKRISQMLVPVLVRDSFGRDTLKRRIKPSNQVA